MIVKLKHSNQLKKIKRILMTILMMTMMMIKMIFLLLNYLLDWFPLPTKVPFEHFHSSLIRSFSLGYLGTRAQVLDVLSTRLDMDARRRRFISPLPFVTISSDLVNAIVRNCSPPMLTDWHPYSCLVSRVVLRCTPWK